jgi:hypothetical protein
MPVGAGVMTTAARLDGSPGTADSLKLNPLMTHNVYVAEKLAKRLLRSQVYHLQTIPMIVDL